MLTREVEFSGRFAAFYHSYSHTALLYEFHCAVATLVYNLPAGFPPLPRLLKAPFDALPSLDILLQEFRSMDRRDHDARFRAVALSVSCSLFSEGEAAPLEYFRDGYSCTDLSYSAILDHLLLSLGVSDTIQRAGLFEDILICGAKHGLNTQVFEKSGGGKRVPKRRKQKLGMSAAKNSANGHMLQLFVAFNSLDELGYGSLPFGVVDTARHPLAQYLRSRHREIGGQARLFVHPTVCMDAKTVCIFHYAADPGFDRQALQHDLLHLLTKGQIQGNEDDSHGLTAGSIAKNACLSRSLIAGSADTGSAENSTVSIPSQELQCGLLGTPLGLRKVYEFLEGITPP
jgi:hypothetical protein